MRLHHLTNNTFRLLILLLFILPAHAGVGLNGQNIKTSQQKHNDLDRPLDYVKDFSQRFSQITDNIGKIENDLVLTNQKLSELHDNTRGSITPQLSRINEDITRLNKELLSTKDKLDKFQEKYSEYIINMLMSLAASIGVFNIYFYWKKDKIADEIFDKISKEAAKSYGNIASSSSSDMPGVFNDIKCSNELSKLKAGAHMLLLRHFYKTASSFFPSGKTRKVSTTLDTHYRLAKIIEDLHSGHIKYVETSINLLEGLIEADGKLDDQDKINVHSFSRSILPALSKVYDNKNKEISSVLHGLNAKLGGTI